MLGEKDKPKTSSTKHKGRFVNKKNYYDLLDQVFGSSSTLMKQGSVIYIRTDKREFTLNTTREILKKCFPDHKEPILYKPITKVAKTQTKLFGDKSLKPGEVDIPAYSPDLNPIERVWKSCKRWTSLQGFCEKKTRLAEFFREAFDIHKVQKSFAKGWC